MHPDTHISNSRFPLHTNMGIPKMPPWVLASGPNPVGQQITARSMRPVSKIFTSLWASLLTVFAKRITSISSGVLNTRLQRQKVVYYKEMCATWIFKVIFQRKNKKALWFSVFPGFFVSVVVKGVYFQYSNFELYSYFSNSERGLKTKFQHTSLEANTRDLFRN